MTRIFRIFSAVCALCLLCAPGAAEQRLTVFAAASLKDALDEAAAAYPGAVVVSYGGSGQVARQVAQGAPADLVVLANTAWMDWLAAQGWPVLVSRRDLLTNRLVLVGPVGSANMQAASDIAARLAGGRLALGMTQSVPAGIYARQWMERAGLWAQLRPQLAETENVRAALALVARGEAPLGVVYASDAQAEPAVGIVYEIPADLHDPIRYPLAVLDGKNVVQASDFAEFLASDRGREIFVRHGFGVSP